MVNLIVPAINDEIKSSNPADANAIIVPMIVNKFEAGPVSGEVFIFQGLSSIGKIYSIKHKESEREYLIINESGIIEIRKD